MIKRIIFSDSVHDDVDPEGQNGSGGTLKGGATLRTKAWKTVGKG